MAFQESARSLHARLHVGAKAPLVVGVTLAAALVLAAAGFMLAGPGKGGFSVERADASEPQAGADAAAAGEGAVGAGQGASAEPGGGAEAALRVHVGGAVASPGVYEVDAGSRVEDAVEAAGGLAEGAAPDALNLARPLADGEQVIVPTLEEVEQSAAAGSALGAASGAGGASPASGKVNLNTAGADSTGRVAGHRPGDGGEDRGGPAEQRAFRRRRRPQAGVGHRRQEVRAAGRPRLASVSAHGTRTSGWRTSGEASAACLRTRRARAALAAAPARLRLGPVGRRGRVLCARRGHGEGPVLAGGGLRGSACGRGGRSPLARQARLGVQRVSGRCAGARLRRRGSRCSS